MYLRNMLPSEFYCTECQRTCSFSSYFKGMMFRWFISCLLLEDTMMSLLGVVTPTEVMFASVKQ